ncbi:MAG: hypothetical protein ACOC6P_01040 [Candidatus Aminicenantaceae bacterium]
MNKIKHCFTRISMTQWSVSDSYQYNRKTHKRKYKWESSLTRVVLDHRLEKAGLTFRIAIFL